jgi:EAL domain-containing protein (putative c-di-GMP-specific phosphodiesterase class I)/GGDEF domain-containing protein
MRWLDLGALSEENVKLRNLLFDEVTKLPTVSLLLGQIRTLLKTHKQIGLIYIDVTSGSKIQETFGYQTFEQVVNKIGQTLSKLRGQSFRENDTVAAVMKSGNDFIVLLSPPREKNIIEMKDLLVIRGRILKTVRESIAGILDPPLVRRFHLRSGAAIIEDEPNIRVEHLVYDTLQSAKESARLKELEQREKEVEKLRQVLDRGEITTLFQPIVNLSNFKIIAYEAFSRGPDGFLEYPETLFKLAAEGDLVWKLDRVCRDKAFLAAKGMKADLLFLNINPHAIGDPEFKEISKSVCLKHSDLSIDRIVFDLSEQAMVQDFDLFNMTLNYFKTLGFKISIDDAGSGFYAGLQIIARAKPDFVKIDSSLVQGVEKDKVKQELISTIINFASMAKATVGAEGIETIAQLKTLKELGVKIGQGHLFAEPAYPFPPIKKPSL